MLNIDWSTIGKYGTGAVVLGSLFFLVYIGKVDAQIYVATAMSVLAGIGIVTGQQANVSSQVKREVERHLSDKVNTDAKAVS